MLIPFFNTRLSPSASEQLRWACLILALLFPNTGRAAEFIRLTEENYQKLVPPGKEVDAIYGDWILRNEQVVAVVAQPKPGRNANMTVRGVSGMLIDFTRRSHGSDQLSCFYPAAGRYRFEDPAEFRVTVDGESHASPFGTERYEGSQIQLTAVGSAIAEDASLATLVYTLGDGHDWLDYHVEITNTGDRPLAIRREDSLRCDGDLFETGTREELQLYYAADQYFGQAYGFVASSGIIRAEAGRNKLMRYVDGGEGSAASGAIRVEASESIEWGGKLSCSQGLPGILCWAESIVNDERRADFQLQLQSSHGPVSHAIVELTRGDQALGAIQTGSDGIARGALTSGNYTANIRSPGRADRVHEFDIGNNLYASSLTLEPAARVRAKIVDQADRPIPAKVQFLGTEGTADPDWGPDSAISAIRNVVYSADGTFEQPIDAGTYVVIASHGPEYNARVTSLDVQPGSIAPLELTLARVVDTSGWVSAELHSHSSPSGDNVSHQRGRVLNLLAEHIEFGPCTEHNRIDSYSEHLETLNATELMATCSGMELTGSPLPINHQNAFPLHHHPHHQDGGGPQTDADPVKQIERLALWDDAAAKVVQVNHPNIPQILGDRDLDGEPDDGFRGMLGWMDVIEVHPPQGIFDFPDADIAPEDKRNNRIFFWLQLLNLGYRIPGVVNTDAHYNFHGSGWLRNYFLSSTDDPAEIDLDEMIHAAEHGHIIMTTGPFLEAEVQVEDERIDRSESDEGGDRQQPVNRFISGEHVDLSAWTESEDATSPKLWVRVQCPNWFDVNRVQVFLNGRPAESLNFTRQSHPQLFSNNHVRFEHRLTLPPMDTDTHVIVATIGEGLKLGPVMGEDRGELPPVAVANPIFLDVDGGGFQANGDNLGVPFMLPDIDEQTPPED